MNYHNTNNLRGDELKQADKRATNQNEWVKHFFERNMGVYLTPSAVKRAYDKQLNTDVLLTSIRRAMSDLSKGINPPLHKSELTTKSPRGGREGYWIMHTSKSVDLFNGGAEKSRQEQFGGL